MDIAFNNREKILFRGMKYCSMILLPAAVIYVVLMLFNINKYTNGVYLGKIDYMSLTYTHMIPMFFMLLYFILRKNEDNVHVEDKIKKSILLSTIVLFWILMIFTGLRGGLISVVWFFICTLFFLIKNNYDKRSLSKIAVAFFSLWVFFTFIYTPAGLQNSVSRVKSMGVGIEKLSFSEADKAAYSWVMSEEEAQEVMSFKYLKNRAEVDQAWLNLANRNDKIKNCFEIAGGVIPFFNRTMLYDFAWYEFYKNHFKGIGAFNYTDKYRTFPHNILLEILYEWGIIIFALYIVGILLLLRKIYNSNDSDVQIMFLFFVGLIPMLMISGSIYTSYLHIIFIVYASCVGKTLLKE